MIPLQSQPLKFQFFIGKTIFDTSHSRHHTEEIMPSSYTEGQGKRRYQSYDPKDLEAALTAVKNGMPQAQASRTYNVTRSTLQNRLSQAHTVS
ncbi:hypothetical protein HOLleu_00737 [Holothuria leucospilota]|uniref:HTH psq-type domain-containing protein n=1 Tax=Holothuria leucospilota TaxID=206669 RepID=A0A9Q1CQ22_HOLLE|nr:hypothetical protein HOLleu_00737 [Holothuria leucospilota]